MNTQTQTQTSGMYKGGVLGRIQAQWVADWMKSEGIALPSGWTSIWKMNAKQIAAKYKVTPEDVIAAANGEKR